MLHLHPPSKESTLPARRAHDLVDVNVTTLCPISKEDWHIIIFRLGLVGRLATMEDWEANHANHDYGVMLYREFGLNYREER